MPSTKQVLQSLQQIPKVRKFAVGQVLAASKLMSSNYSVKEGTTIGLCMGYTQKTTQIGPSGLVEPVEHWHPQASDRVMVLLNPEIAPKFGHVLCRAYENSPGPLEALSFAYFGHESLFRSPSATGLELQPVLGLFLAMASRIYPLTEVQTESGPLGDTRTTFFYQNPQNELADSMSYSAAAANRIPIRICYGTATAFQFPALGFGPAEPEEATLPPLNVKDLVLITDPSRIGGLSHSKSLLTGIPAICMTPFSGVPSSTGSIQLCGGKMATRPLNVNRSALSPVPEPWFMAEDRVEVIASVTFKKRQLMGQRGRVLSYPDQDGDVGVEFNLPLEAGSLDGLGRDGHCLYVPAKALKKI